MVLVIDYGMSNLGSIRRALEECGADVIVSNNPNDLKLAERIILPGVGAFGDGMKNLREQGWIDKIKEEVFNNNIPMLGICLGMQLLADKGFEGGENEGLGLIPGEVKKLQPFSKEERIPHIGWNEVHKVTSDRLLEDIPDGSDFYFVHSYYFEVKDNENIIAYTPYCGKFPSVINAGNVYGTQFHPEKSIPVGFRLLKNFLNL
jgi:imidazole glycerol-phosphate synthase subunit HisH